MELDLLDKEAALVEGESEGIKEKVRVVALLKDLGGYADVPIVVILNLINWQHLVTIKSVRNVVHQ
jgi:hypothetical protein